MKKILIILFLAFISPFSNSLADPNLANEDTSDLPDMTGMRVFYMVMLNRGSKRDHPQEEVMQIQRDHLANITRLAKEGYIVMAGPMMEDGDLRGIFIFDAENKEIVDSLCKTDPAIAAGRLDYVIHSWFTKEGVCLPEIE